MVCPHCYSPARDDWPAEYRCKTVNLSGRITRSPVCFEDQIAQLRAKVKRLEEAFGKMEPFLPLQFVAEWNLAKATQ